MLLARLWGEGQPAKTALTVDDASVGAPQLEGAAAEGEYGPWLGQSSLPQIPPRAPPLRQPAPQAPPGPALGGYREGQTAVQPEGATLLRLCRGWGCGAGRSTAWAAAPSRSRAALRGCEAKAEKVVTSGRRSGEGGKGPSKLVRQSPQDL